MARVRWASRDSLIGLRYLVRCRGDTGIGMVKSKDTPPKKSHRRSLSKFEKEDQGVGSSPLSSRSIMSSPSLEREENHYSNDAVEKANENCKEHGNWNTRKKRNLNTNGRQEAKLESQKPPKDGNESQTHGLSNALLHSSVDKN